MRWLFHILRTDDVPSWLSAGASTTGQRYAPASLAREGFIHASYRDAVRESARLYFPAGVALSVLVVDPRRLDVPVVVADTPRGPMPHIHGSIPSEAIRLVSLAEVDEHADDLA